MGEKTYSELMDESPVYVSHKKVKKFQMTRGTYNHYRGWENPKDEDPHADGYLVEYMDGGEPNHPEHKGYISWTPKEQFDSGYKAIPTGHEQRVVEERAELSTKLDALGNFIKSKLFSTIPKIKRTHLITQFGVMTEYLNILDERITSF